MKCSKCGFNEQLYVQDRRFSEGCVEFKNKFCPNCGAELKELCPNCNEPRDGNCACFRNKCRKCGEPVGNITFTVCDDCWDKELKDKKKVRLYLWAWRQGNRENWNISNELSRKKSHSNIEFQKIKADLETGELYIDIEE